MKKFVIFQFLFFIFTSVFSKPAQPLEQPEDVVRKYARCISTWFSTKDYKFANEIERLSSGHSFRVNNRIIFDYARRKDMPILEHYDIDDYIMCLKDVLIGNKINLQISNINRHYDVSYSDDNSRKLYYVSCSVNADGASALSGQELFYIRKNDGKIVKIGPYNEMSNRITGKKEVVIETSDVNWDHIAAGEFNSIEVSYGYSKNFPLNLGVFTNFSYFNIGLEYGQNFDKTPLVTKQHSNFAVSSLEGKCFYLMGTPGVFLRWATINCGFGATITKYKYESIYSSNTEKNAYFCMKPRISFNLPIPLNFKSQNEKFYISPYVGYLYVPKLTKLNNLEFGVGLRFRFETY